MRETSSQEIKNSTSGKKHQAMQNPTLQNPKVEQG
jgi:hypothetical protein